MNEHKLEIPEKYRRASKQYLGYLSRRLRTSVTCTYYGAVVRYEVRYPEATDIYSVMKTYRDKFREQALKLFWPSLHIGEEWYDEELKDVAIWQNGDRMVVDVPVSTLD